MWKQMTSDTAVSPDVRLLCLNAMCDNNLACAKNCLGHVTTKMDLADVPKWQQCTYSSRCSTINSYVLKEECADRCLHEYKAELQHKAEMNRSEERRRKEAEALQSTGGAASLAAWSLLSVVSAAVLSKLSL
jgi:hypothetical protein